MESLFNDKIILVIGGTGSFGTAFVKFCLARYRPQAIRIFSRGEFLQSEMAQKFNNDRLRFFIGDVRDRDRLYRAVEGVDIVIHAAALKQIPTAEYNPAEAIKTNIGGAINVVDATLDNNVKKVMAISTDKACHPVNLYGATKLVAEKLFIQANVYAGKKDTKFSCVRYGNVLGSRGSILPLFLKQKEVGELTITDERMTRFWITLEQGVRFVSKCLDEMLGGEIFIPKIPSMKVIDMANAIAPEAIKKIIGLRPGEKLHEVLLTEEESRHTREFDDHYVIIPEFSFRRENKFDGIGRALKESQYSSGTNTWWLTKEELKNMAGIN